MLREAERCSDAEVAGGYSEAPDGWQKEEPTEKGLYVHYSKAHEAYILITIDDEDALHQPDCDMYLKVEYPDE